MIPTHEDEIADRLEQALTAPRPPADVQLAVALSVATRIEPELVRAVRLKVLPHLDIGAESDFWFSDWIGPRQPHVVALRYHLLDRLRKQLGAWHTEGKFPRIHNLRAVIKAVHQTISPALALEEEIVWRYATGGEHGLRSAAELLRQATTAMEGGRDTVADWVAGATLRLPQPVLDSTDGWHLVLHARHFRPRDIPEPKLEDKLTDAAAARRLYGPVALSRSIKKDVTVHVAWDGDTLVLGAAASERTASIRLPSTVPPFIEVLTVGEDDEGKLYRLDPGTTIRHDSGGRDLRLRTVDGRVYEVPRAVGDSVQAPPVLIQVPGPQAVMFWLQPVRYDADGSNTDDRRVVKQPTKVLARVFTSVTADPDAFRKLAEWRSAAKRFSVLLLTDGQESHRLLLADQFGADSQRNQWQVYRARQDPGAAIWLTDHAPESGAAGMLVVIDRADTWHVPHLVKLLEEITSEDTRPVRVLLLAGPADVWWSEFTREFGARTGALDRLQLARDPYRSPTPVRAVFDDALTTAVQALALRGGSSLSSRLPRAWPSANLSDVDTKVLAVAAALEAQAGRDIRVEPSLAATTLLRHEHDFRVFRDPEVDRGARLAKLVFLSALMRPFTHSVAIDVSVHFGLITDRDDWLDLLNDYNTFYRSDQDILDPFGSTGLADELIAAALASDDTVGLDANWARRDVAEKLMDLADGETPHCAQGLSNALTVLARIADTHPDIATTYLHPIIDARPDLLVRAGASAIVPMARIPANRVAHLLEKVRIELSAQDGRRIDLDLAFNDIEEFLITAALARTPATPDQRAPLYLRLAKSRHQVGLLYPARDAALSAVAEYRKLRTVAPEGLCDALILESKIRGELHDPRHALELAEEAEKLSSQLIDRVRGTVASAPGLANLARQRALAGRKEGALTAANDAVRVLDRLVQSESSIYLAELADALIVQSDRLAEADRPAQALSAAERAADLAEQLVERNEWAYGDRLAAALLCLGARHAQAGTLPEALDNTEQAVQLLQKPASVSPRFQQDLAVALTAHAGLLLRTTRAADALAAADQAVTLLRKLVSSDRRLRRAELATALVRTAQAQIALADPADARTRLDEAISLLEAISPLPDPLRATLIEARAIQSRLGGLGLAGG
jgi:hypothetical protein